jgi:hypothetical protein
MFTTLIVVTVLDPRVAQFTKTPGRTNRKPLANGTNKCKLTFAHRGSLDRADGKVVTAVCQSELTRHRLSGDQSSSRQARFPHLTGGPVGCPKVSRNPSHF